MNLDQLLEEEVQIRKEIASTSIQPDSNCCKECKSSSIDKKFNELFKLKVCFECKVSFYFI